MVYTASPVISEIRFSFNPTLQALLPTLRQSLNGESRGRVVDGHVTYTLPYTSIVCFSQPWFCLAVSGWTGFLILYRYGGTYFRENDSFGSDIVAMTWGWALRMVDY